MFSYSHIFLADRSKSHTQESVIGYPAGIRNNRQIC